MTKRAGPGMNLAELFKGQPVSCLTGGLGIEVSGLTHDSRRVRPGVVFVCLPGRHHDGRDFAAQAVARGAVAVVTEAPPPVVPASATLLVTPDARRSLALAAAAWWRYPAAQLRLLGVTGTNGKTTVNHLVEAILLRDGRRTGLLGTVENHLGGRIVAAGLTTPDSWEFQAGLRAMVEAGLTAACVEVSSHALSGHRLAGCAVDVATLTNVARDHLEFHESIDAYAKAKLSLFRRLGQVMGLGDGWSAPNAEPAKSGPVYAVLNGDDPFFDSFRRKVTQPYLVYAAMRPGHIRLLGAVMGASGSTVRIGLHLRPRGLPSASWVTGDPGWPRELSLAFPHPGRHNVANLLAALTVAWAEGCGWEAVRAAVESFTGVKGRWELVPGPNGVTGVVDFAHNPGGLIGALETARLVSRRRVILVFGCEGRKDRGKRPAMGAIASRLADHVVLTTDNTFGEDRRQIMRDVESGLRRGTVFDAAPNRATYEIVENRREAIYRAVQAAKDGDLVVVAGRGHDVKLVFGSEVETLDDREVLKAALASEGHH
jgi:UDP-N-acetylmuramoyl-L-alanyl-D-glutamate--2,6-diaminopimelate ligase